jgi:hypothetical protein
MLVAGIQSAAPVSAAAPAVLQIQTLSNRADLVSGGEVLTEVRLPAGASVSSLRVSLDGRDVTSQFALRPNH